MEVESQGTLDDKKIISQDSDTKEIDTKEILEEMYHGWLGEKIVDNVWVRDPSLKRMMNESGASFLISEIKSRFNTHTHFSVLDVQDIRDIVGDTGINIAKILKYDYYKYEIEAKHITDVCDQITHSLRIFLNIPLLGGFRQFRENKTKTIINKVGNVGGEE